jgi:hypothetical protein
MGIEVDVFVRENKESFPILSCLMFNTLFCLVTIIRNINISVGIDIEKTSFGIRADK